MGRTLANGFENIFPLDVVLTSIQPLLTDQIIEKLGLLSKQTADTKTAFQNADATERPAHLHCCRSTGNRHITASLFNSIKPGNARESNFSIAARVTDYQEI